MNEQTAADLRRVMQEATVMSATPFTKQDRANAVVRRGITFLIREIASTGHTFGILAFCREVTRPELLADPVLGVREMERLESVTPSDVPVAYWAMASDVFYEAGLLAGLIMLPTDATVLRGAA